MSIQGVGRYFIFIKNKVSSDWKDLAWCLGFETPDIDNIEGKRRDDKSRCMELLQEWHKRKGNAATIHVLMEALKTAQLQLVVDSLKGEYPELNEKPKSDKGKAENIEAIRKEIKLLEEKNSKALLEQKAEMNKKIQQLQEAIKEMEARNDELLTAKQPVEVRPIRVGQPWVEKVRFGGWGSGRGEFKYPWGVAVSQDNEVYIADQGNIRIQVFTMDGDYIREFTTTLPTGEKLRPEDVAVDRNGNLWVVGDRHVVQYSREGTCLATIDLPHVGYLGGITVAMATEQVIVTQRAGQNGRLRVFNQDGSEVGTYGSGHRSPKPWKPQCVTVDGEGNILVTDDNNHCVHVLDREGNFKFKFGSEGSDESQFKYPQSICVDGMGNIIVADNENRCVKVFDSQGRFLSYIGSGMKKPWAVTVSPGGDVVMTDWEGYTVSVWRQD
ncbi:PREDICTED: E3 ubiquitin-protein ligase TRIM71-like [Branchiostoma belcheri]|uniref:E3 ubiquitin-protein ligase TRIM71-like n=1 Tax=Branchiostoma belcheri TaxID=7741 RepID=A0A6P4Y2B3_BRABE|nr:PREDICTED: E3 ubiquitin-protein ligase TRIM71-like [Branchiostoma belcheri]